MTVKQWLNTHGIDRFWCFCFIKMDILDSVHSVFVAGLLHHLRICRTASYRFDHTITMNQSRHHFFFIWIEFIFVHYVLCIATVLNLCCLFSLFEYSTITLSSHSLMFSSFHYEPFYFFHMYIHSPFTNSPFIRIRYSLPGPFPFICHCIGCCNLKISRPKN